MKILENMTITEAADLIRAKSIEIAKDKNITEQQAYSIVLDNIEENLGGNKYEGCNRV